MVRPVLLFFNKFILTYRLFCGRMAPKGGMPHDTLTCLPVRRLCRGTLRGHRPVRPSDLSDARTADTGRYAPAGAAADGGFLSPRRVDRGCPPGLASALAQDGVEGRPLPGPVRLGLGLWRMAALCLPHLLGAQCGLWGAAEHLLSGLPVLHFYAGGPELFSERPSGQSLCRYPISPAVVPVHGSGRTVAAAAVLFRFSAAPPGEGGFP